MSMSHCLYTCIWSPPCVTPCHMHYHRSGALCHFTCIYNQINVYWGVYYVFLGRLWKLVYLIFIIWCLLVVYYSFYFWNKVSVRCPLNFKHLNNGLLDVCLLTFDISKQPVSLWLCKKDVPIWNKMSQFWRKL